jgi:hypothetical protein
MRDFQVVACSTHARIRAQQRGIPPLIEQWLDEFGEEQYDGHGGVIRFFSRRSIRNMERIFGRAPVRRMSEYLDAYKVESTSDGGLITLGHRHKRIFRK